MVEEVEKNKDKDFEVNLTANDFYKDIKILGYDYGPKFRRIESIKTNDFETLHGSISWEGNIITFLDSLLQIMACAMPFRKMMVPVMIRSLRCDPKVLYEGVAANKLVPELDEKQDEYFETKVKTQEEDLQEILAKRESEGTGGDIDGMLDDNKVDVDYIEEMYGKDFHVYKSQLPFYVEMKSRMIITHGIEIEDLMAFPIPRMSNVQDLKLESYQFVANEDNNAIEECDKKSINEYIKV